MWRPSPTGRACASGTRPARSRGSSPMPPRPFNDVTARRAPAAVAEPLPAWAFGPSLGIDGQHHALRTEHLGTAGDQLRVFQRGGVDRLLVRAVGQELSHVFFF